MCNHRIQKKLTYGFLLLVFSFVEQSTVLCQLKDLFPLGKGSVRYKYRGASGWFRYPTSGRSESYSDSKSGVVIYTIDTPAIIEDSTIRWRVTQLDSATIESYSNGSTSTRTEISSSKFELHESTTSFHGLTAAMMIWNLKGFARYSGDSIKSLSVSSKDVNLRNIDNFPYAFPVNVVFKKDSGLTAMAGSIYTGGFLTFSASVSVQMLSFNIQKLDPVPTQFRLYQNYPNPFNGSTTISLDLPEQALTTIKIYNLLGQQIASLWEGRKDGGRYQLSWTPTDLPTGVYFLKVEYSNKRDIKKMLFVK